MNVKIKKLNENAIVPTYGTDGSAGMDLHVIVPEGERSIWAGETVMFGTGIAFEIPHGYFGLIAARSSTGTKKGLAPPNCVGIIDEDYRNEVKVPLYNHSGQHQVVENGERVAQMILVPYLKAELEVVDELSETKRGLGGFGSTGVK